LYAGVFKSTDAGATWSEANPGLSPSYVSALAIDPNTPGTLYAGTRLCNGYTGCSGSVFKSTDAGANWSAANAGLPKTAHLSGISALALAIDPKTPRTLYVATDGFGVFKSTDAGATWGATGLSGNVLALAIDSITPGTLYAATYQGVYKSTDGASSWQAFNAGLSNTSVLALAIDPMEPRRVYAGTDGGGVFAIEQVSTCTGDCDGNGMVAINELILGVNIALGVQPATACSAFANLEGVADIAQLLKGVSNALDGCGG